MTVAELLRRRRAVAQNESTLRTNDALFDAARDLRRRAQPFLTDGRPELAQPYLDEAEVFESAVDLLPGL